MTVINGNQLVGEKANHHVGVISKQNDTEKSSGIPAQQQITT